MLEVWTKNYDKDANSRYKNYSHTVYLEEFNCIEREISLLQVVEYDLKGNVLNYQGALSSVKQRVIPGSIGEGNLDAICKIQSIILQKFKATSRKHKK